MPNVGVERVRDWKPKRVYSTGVRYPHPSFPQVGRVKASLSFGRFSGARVRDSSGYPTGAKGDEEYERIARP